MDANALQSYGQIHFNIYSTNTPPKQDGVINPGEYGDPIVVVNYGSPGSAWYDAGGLDDPIMDLAVVPDILPKDLTLYLTYDDNNLYVGVEYWDGNHCTPDELTGVWDGDYVEFDIATNVSGSFDDAADKLRLAMGISDAGNQWMYSAANQSNALEQFPLNSSTESLPIGKIVRNESTKMTTYEVAIPWSYITSNGKVPANAFIYYQTGVGDHRYIENSPYVAYLGTFRWAVDARLIDDIPANAVPHLGTFAGEAPPPVIEEVVEEVEAPADVGTPAVTPPSGGAAQTSDMFALLGLIAIISMAGVVVIKKRVK
ncbi:MAG: hypothetical protein FWF15_06580 [Oscillospiraceae bacterium]|nr:hypothetical protein [Oscillospiraceae bacterium]